MNLGVLADWSKIEKNSYKYTPIDKLFQQTRNQ